MRTLVFYISGHGFGHASRVIEVINTVLAADAGTRVIVRTAAPRWLFDLTVRQPQPIRADQPAVTVHEVETDTGMAQIDSLNLDAAASLREARRFMQDFDAHVERERAFLARLDGPTLVVADTPPLGPAAAARAGVPSVVLGNFTWDWIYAAYDGADDVVRAIREAYAAATLALRLPMHGGFDSIHTVIDVPFITRRSDRPPAETRRRLGLPLDERLALVSFGNYGLQGLDLDAVSRLDGWVALVGGNVPLGNRHDGVEGRQGSLLPIDVDGLYAAGLRYEDLVRAVDAVITKPGYGIVSECIANDTSLLYTSRGHFVEYDVLVAEMPRYLRARHIGHSDLLAGRWAPHLDALVAQPAPPERPDCNGAAVVADRLLAMLNL